MTPLGLAVVALLAATRAVLSVLSALNVRHARRKLAVEGEWIGEHVPVEAGDLLPYLRTRTAVTELQENMTNPFPHPAYAVLALDHPLAPERVRRLASDDATSRPGQTGQPTATDP